VQGGGVAEVLDGSEASSQAAEGQQADRFAEGLEAAAKIAETAFDTPVGSQEQIAIRDDCARVITLLIRSLIRATTDSKGNEG